MFGKRFHSPSDNCDQAISEASNISQKQPHVENSSGVLQADIRHLEFLNKHDIWLSPGTIGTECNFVGLVSLFVVKEPVSVGFNV